MSVFPLTYVGNSLLQQTRDDELETIYELLLTQYLNFLRRVISDGKTIAETLSESFETIIMAIGSGQFTIRTTETERYRDQKIRKHFDQRFTSDQLIYFNCYYFEVVTPMGKDERKCFAYFRRAVDTRRCVPEDALVQLDTSISQWLLRNRHLARPPLLYCIVANREIASNLDCHVFLADNVQVGLRVVRCLAELRQSAEPKFDELKAPKPEKRYQSPRRNVSRRHVVHRRFLDRTGVNIRSPRSRSNEPRFRHPLAPNCPGCILAGERNYYMNIRNEPRIHRSHTDLVHSCLEKPHYASCDLHYCAYCGGPLDSSSSTSDSEDKKRRLLQMKLGQEALDYYERRKRIANKDYYPKGCYHRDQSVPRQIEERMGRISLGDHTNRSRNNVIDSTGRISSSSQRRMTGSASSKSSRTFLDSSLSLLP